MAGDDRRGRTAQRLLAELFSGHGPTIDPAQDQLFRCEGCGTDWPCAHLARDALVEGVRALAWLAAEADDLRADIEAAHQATRDLTHQRPQISAMAVVEAWRQHVDSVVKALSSSSEPEP